MRSAWLALLGVAAGFGLVLAVQPAAAALPEEDPWGAKMCTTGSGAGQCQNPRGIAADPENGRVFIVDQSNRRIVELNALGQFVKAWGWGVDTGAAELETCTEGSGCQQGLSGDGSGQLSAISPGIAVDSAGSIYVTDRGFLGDPNFRVQKFSPAGEFLLMIGGEVNKTKVELGTASEEEENLCPFDPGDECQKATAGSGKGQFGGWPIGDFITVDRKGTATDADDILYVGDAGRVQAFDAAGAYQDECAVPGTVAALDVDSAGDLYLKYSGDAKVRKLTPPPGCELLAAPTFEIKAHNGATVSPTAVALDPAGDLYAFGPPVFQSVLQDPIVKFDPSGEEIERFGKGEFNASTGLATNLCAESEAPGNLYVANASPTNAFVRAYGTAPVGCFKARTLPPTEVEETSATLQGTVNPSGLAVSECFFEYGTTTSYGELAECEPSAAELSGTEPVGVSAEISGLAAATVHHARLIAVVGGETETGSDVEFKTKGPPVISEDHVVSVAQSEASLAALVNPEGLPSSYSFQYTTEAEFEAQGFAGAQSTPATAIGEDREPQAAAATIKGLTPGTGYRWRVLATNTAALDGGIAEGPTRSLRTYLPLALETDCPNQAFRVEASAFLPDCRAYEMVSPVDKNGGDIVRGAIQPSDPDGFTQAAPEGNRITYTSVAPFGELEAGANFNQYLAERAPGEGWANRGIRPPVRGEGIRAGSFNTDRLHLAFTPDLCQGWLVDEQTPPMTAEGIDGYANLYRRGNCEPGEGELEAVSDVVPPEGTSPFYLDKRTPLGVSADGRHALFDARPALTPEAPGGGSDKLYDRFGGELHLVSRLPSGAPSAGKLGAGEGWLGNLDTAVSEDGSRVYWTSGRLFLRIDPERPQSAVAAGRCSEPGKACTVAVSGPSIARFWVASADGSKALYTDEAGELREFDLARHEAEEAASQTIAKGVLGVLGAAEDLSRAYFISRQALPGSGANSEGAEAVAGAPNIYAYEAGAAAPLAFVGTVSERDVGEREPGAPTIAYNLVGLNPTFRATRVSADGTALAFNSRAALSGYDNTDTESGKAAVEVFVYRAEEGELHCASCNPGGARPEAIEEMKEAYGFPWEANIFKNRVPAAAFLPTWEQPTYASRPLSADGGRLFFNSYDALLPRDTNGTMDVYEWEAPGTGSCTAEEDNPNYFPDNGGCVYLISSGESSYESEFWEASAEGRDVFFTTEASLVPPDPGSIDLYNARVGGGFAYPEPGSECEGEACQSPPAAPAFTTPSSSLFSGPANPRAMRRCAVPARRAARLARQARRSRKAAARTSQPRRARQLRRRSVGLAKRAKRMSRNAKRCRAANRRAAR